MRTLFGIACFAPVLVLGAFVAMALQEWWSVGVVSDPAVLSQYPFGTEGPVAGIEHYSSPQAYAQHQLFAAITCVALGIAFVAAWLRRSRSILMFTYIVTAGLTAWSVSRSL